ncbi:MAG: type II toxin-antitoxin system death-on-curing family toxin [Caulobacter sp.]|nr:type II toxin-antitoxin system death-on-curing family toxin [Caulobacter sp.]
MAEPEWIEVGVVKTLHDRSIALHGGLPGFRDEGLLESALDCARNRYVYEGVEDMVDLAATYGVAVAANHPLADGNKRAAFLCVLLFLRLNGRRLTADRADATRIMLAVAAGALDIDQLAEWIRRNVASA